MWDVRGKEGKERVRELFKATKPDSHSGVQWCVGVRGKDGEKRVREQVAPCVGVRGK